MKPDDEPIEDRAGAGTVVQRGGARGGRDGRGAGSADDDLLRPTLTAADDVAGFDRPWDPGSLVFLTFFCGLPAGGALLALNERRLGNARRFPSSVAIVIVASLILYAVVAWFIAGGASTGRFSDEDRLPQFGGRLASILVAGWIARGQQKRFRLARIQDVSRGKLLWPAVSAFVVGNAVITLYVLAVVSMFRALGLK